MNEKDKKWTDDHDRGLVKELNRFFGLDDDPPQVSPAELWANVQEMAERRLSQLEEQSTSGDS